MMIFATIALFFMFGGGTSSGSSTGCRSFPADVVFLLDASGSVGPDNFKLQKEFIANFSREFQIGPNNVQISIVTFSSGPYMEFKLNAYNDLTHLLAAIDKVVYLFGATRTGEALKFVRTQTFTAAAGDRDHVTDILIVMTDGKSDFPSKTVTEAALVHQRNIKVIAIGIGHDSDVTELRTLASDPQDAFQVASFVDLSKIQGTLQSAACSKTSAPTAALTFNKGAGTTVAVTRHTAATITRTSAKTNGNGAKTTISATNQNGVASTIIPRRTTGNGSAMRTTRRTPGTTSSTPAYMADTTSTTPARRTTGNGSPRPTNGRTTGTVVAISSKPAFMSGTESSVAKIVEVADKTHIIVCIVLGSVLAVLFLVFLLVQHYAKQGKRVPKTAVKALDF